MYHLPHSVRSRDILEIIVQMILVLKIVIMKLMATKKECLLRASDQSEQQSSYFNDVSECIIVVMY